MLVLYNKRVKNYEEFLKDYLEPFLLSYSKYSSDYQFEIKGLLLLCLRKSLKNHSSCFEPIDNPNELPSNRLKKKFNKKTNSWRRFEPDEDLERDIQQIASWIHYNIQTLREDYSGAVRALIRKKMSSFKTIPDILNAIPCSALDYDELQQAKATRLKPDEETAGEIEYIVDLPERHFLVRILTQQGMINAGHNAHNCLGSLKLPLGTIPHRKRVEHPDKWLYFSIRDPENRSVVTLGVDVRRGRIFKEANHQQNIKDEHWRFINPAEDAIKRQFLDQRSQNHKPPHGSQAWLARQYERE